MEWTNNGNQLSSPVGTFLFSLSSFMPAARAMVSARAAKSAASTFSASGPVRADIKIGQTAAFTGPGAATVLETTEGARLYFDAFNAQGGIKGQRIELISLDDKYEPRLSAANTKTLIEQGVLAMFLSRGTAPSQAMLPLLAELAVLESPRSDAQPEPARSAPAAQAASRAARFTRAIDILALARLNVLALPGARASAACGRPDARNSCS